MVTIIGLSGKMGSGKSEAFKYIQSVSKDREVVLVKFAQPLYDIQEFVYNRIKSVYSRPESFIKDRKLLQYIGTDWGRNTISENIWVDIWISEVLTQTTKYNRLVVCDDVRFDNEAQTVKNLGGKIIQLFSSRTAERIDTQSGIKDHSSEKGISENFVDIVLENNGTMEEYKNSLSILCRKLGIAENNKTEYSNSV